LPGSDRDRFEREQLDQATQDKLEAETSGYAPLWSLSASSMTAATTVLFVLITPVAGTTRSASVET
jgi:hypothetical protein